MIAALKLAMEKAEKLSEKEQEAIAKLILDEVEWNKTFANSSDQLSMLANEAVEEYKKGKTKPMSFE